MVIITWVGSPVDSLDSVGQGPIDSLESVGSPTQVIMTTGKVSKLLLSGGRMPLQKVVLQDWEGKSQKSKDSTEN